jgi:hypothetical protein
MIQQAPTASIPNTDLASLGTKKVTVHWPKPSSPTSSASIHTRGVRTALRRAPSRSNGAAGACTRTPEAAHKRSFFKTATNRSTSGDQSETTSYVAVRGERREQTTIAVAGTAEVVGPDGSWLGTIEETRRPAVAVLGGHNPVAFSIRLVATNTGSTL